tara:strand:+ start:74 stop:766 length:693 start_codon:yes stop_codon:yes gene_type:complete
MLNQALVLKSRVNSGFAITDIETLKVWFKFNTGQGAITDGIQWNDSSGNNNHASQTADAQEGSGFSGGGFVTDSDNNDNLDFSTTFVESGDYHVFMVLDLSEENSETFISSANNTSFMRFANGGTATAFKMKNGGTVANITLSEGFGTTKAIAEVSRNPSNLVRVGRNGVSLGTGTGAGSFSFEQIGASTGASSLTTATIFEVVIFSSLLSASDSDKVRNDIADRNSISL